MRLISSRHRSALRRVSHHALIVSIRWAEGAWGPDSLPWVSLPWTLWEILRRVRDLRYFRQLRSSLPGCFWGRCRALPHFIRMVAHWQGALCCCLLYDRLDSAAWQDRIRVEGTSPDQLPEWQGRPVVLAFLHSGGFPVLRYWLRSRRIPAATFVGGVPPPLDHPAFLEIRAEGDRRYGLDEIPHLCTPDRLRGTLRFLVPGRTLAVALDGIATPGPLVDCPLDPERSLSVKDGAFRLAARTSALLLPVAVKQTGFLRFVVTFGPPVPDECLRHPDPHQAHRHLVGFLWAQVQESPGSLSWATLESLAPGTRRSRTAWP